MPGRNAKRHTLSTKNDQSTNTRDHYVTFAPNASTHPNYKSRQFPVLVLKTMSKFHQAEFVSDWYSASDRFKTRLGILLSLGGSCGFTLTLLKYFGTVSHINP